MPVNKKSKKKISKNPSAKEKVHGNSAYTKALGEAICDRLICGKDDKPESLRSICRDEGMPKLATVMRWLSKHKEFREQYAHARELQQEHSLEEIIEIADNCTDDVIFLTSEDSHGEGAKPAIKHSAIARARLQIDTRKWAMSKLAPKKYGDKLAIGGDNDADPINIALNDKAILSRFLNGNKPTK